MSGRVAVYFCGNPGRGDDALGPLLAERAERWCAAHSDTHVQVIVDLQLQVEHALDLEGCDLALFVDAAVTGPAPYRLTRVAAAPEPGFSTHSLSPAAVLDVRTRVCRHEPPPAFQLAVRAYEFELGAAPTASAAANLEAAWRELENLLATPTLAAWEALAD